VTVFDLRKDGRGDDRSDAGDGLQRGEFGGVVLLGRDFDVAFESPDLGVQRAEQIEPRLDSTLGVRVGDVGGDGVAFGNVLHIGADCFEVQLPAHGVDVAIEFGTLSDESESRAQEVAQAASLVRVGVGEWEVAAAQEPGEDFGVVRVGFGLRGVNGFDAEGVSERERDVAASAGVGEPVPGVDALAPDEQVGRERFDGREERLGLGGHVAREFDRSGLVEDTDEERSCVQVDADVRCGSGSQVTHDEASGVRERTTLRKD
jgi:hypothetical protein